ncbi:MAG: ElyC/SanA/YdcF family protein [Cyclobacteriaceae bacterium]
MKKIIKLFTWSAVSVVLFILITNIWVVSSTADNIYSEEDIPGNKVALVLGTSKRTIDGSPNRFFVERMSAAAALYGKDKVRHLLVSGDNSSKYYNEPRDMLNALGDLNIPDKDITMDFAGFRTLDSVVRSKEVFGQDSITIVTQQFHCYRSLFIANKFGIKAIAYSADKDQSIGLSLAFREILARSFAVADLYIFQRKPKFLGEEIELEIK